MVVVVARFSVKILLLQLIFFVHPFNIRWNDPGQESGMGSFINPICTGVKFRSHNWGGVHIAQNWS